MTEYNITAHFGKKRTTIVLNVPLTTQEREILKEAILKVAEALKVDNVKITETKPPKLKPKPKEIIKEKEEVVEIDYEAAEKHFKEMEELFNSFEKPDTTIDKK